MRELIGTWIVLGTITSLCAWGWYRAEERASETLKAVAALAQRKSEANVSTLELLTEEVKGKDQSIKLLGDQLTDIAAQLQACRYGQ